jgi:hypothetical protein
LRRGSLARIGWLAAAVVLGLAGFLQSVHLGHTITDDETGSFDSRYTERELHHLAAEREQRWRTHPPEPQGPLAREDQYLSEALGHVQERNDGDSRVAWRENRILEKFYGPVLEIRAGSTLAYRWPREQRAELASHVADDQQAYISAALPVPVFKWPKALFWMLVAIAAPCMVTEWRRA